MSRIIVIALVFGMGVMMPAGADKDRVSDWLVRDRPKLVETARTVKLAILCQRLPAPLDRAAFAILMRERAGATAPMDRDYAALAISEGEGLALIDYKYAAATTCAGLGPAELAAATDFFAGRRGLRIVARDGDGSARR